MQQDDTILVTWQATDPSTGSGQAPSGIAACVLAVQAPDGAWINLSSATSGTYDYTPDTPGHLYVFRVTAADTAGNEASAEDGAGLPRTTKYYYHGGKRVAMREGDVVYYLHGDHLGSTSLTTDGSGAVVARQLYHPYGEVRWSEGTLPTDFGFTGQRRDGTGLVFMHARYYHAGLGRFVSADTIVPNPSDPQSLNRYSYVLNSPLNYRDPSGHVPWFDWIVGAAVQFSNNMLCGVPYLVYNEVLGPFWDERQSYAFQQGQQFGQAASQVAGTAMTVDGAVKIAAGIAAGPPTVAVSAAAALPTGGISIVGGGVALTAEGVLVVTGVAEAGYGATVLYASGRNQPQQPRYTRSNFRRNLENRTPIPRGMQKPEAHHMLPKELVDQFDELFDINVHDPRWGAWAEGGWHQSVHAQGYNAEWAQWLDANHGATLMDVAARAQYMAQKYGFNWSWQP